MREGVKDFVMILLEPFEQKRVTIEDVCDNIVKNDVIKCYG
jgi:hypothetical protein